MTHVFDMTHLSDTTHVFHMTHVFRTVHLEASQRLGQFSTRRIDLINLGASQLRFSRRQN